MINRTIALKKYIPGHSNYREDKKCSYPHAPTFRKAGIMRILSALLFPLPTATSCILT